MKGMELLKFIIYKTLLPFGWFLFGFGLSQIVQSEYELSAFIFLSLTILYMIGYFTEVWTKDTKK